MAFSLAFPDRRDDLKCQHMGMPDRHDLTVQLDVDASGELRKAVLAEQVSPGGL